MAFRKIATAICCLLLSSVQASSQDTPFTTTVVPAAINEDAATLPETKPAPIDQPPSTTKKALSQAAVVAAIIAASIAFYKSDSGGPCACPEDRARNGSRCGKRSAHSKSGGYDVTCYPSDVTPAMISSWRAENEK